MKCLIILGGGLNEKEEPNEHTKLRYDQALKIQNRFDYIICSAGFTYRKEGKGQKISEAEAGKRYLISKKVTPEKIILEDKSKDTFSNAFYCRKILDKLKIKEFTVVTSKFHLKKAKFVFKVVFPQKEYQIKFVKSKNGKISKGALRNRKINEKEVLKFYRKHLFNTYGLKRGDLKSIEKFLRNHNLATSGKMDRYQQELTDRINRQIDQRSPLLY